MPITQRKSGLQQSCRPSLVKTGLRSVAKGIQDYGTAGGTKTVLTGETVLLAGGYGNGGTAGSVYRRKAADASIALGTEDYSATANWTLQGTTAAFTARSEAVRDVIIATPNGINIHNHVRTKND